MEYIANNKNFEFKNTAVTLGKFDGLHLGHQLLINHVLDLKNKGYSSVVFTFLLHPNSLFSQKEVELIFIEEEKRNKLDKMGIDVMISYPFNKETAAMEPEDFIKKVLIEQLDAKVIVVGSDFGFGHKRRGNVDMLIEMSSVYGYEVIVLDKKKITDQTVSSSYIRNELTVGNMEKVTEFLGEPYSIMGQVKHGRKIGRTLGFPTTNLIPPSNKLLPTSGVYVSITTIDGVRYEGVTNIGNNPTVGETKEKRVETYIFDYDEDCYGKTIEVSILSMERPEIKYDTIEELKEQMDKDIIFAREYFKKNPIK